ncbi:MAG: AraC family transcriptional regulator ligand-binding domain-containing protein [Rhodocyclaceae bacterium]|nr:AraC family transcriptional regulator ligand-binding domain-containing protein [Rhodocyclaceae bacterium]
MLHRTTPVSSHRSHATVAMGFVSGMLAGLVKKGIDPAPLLAAAEIDIADAATRIPVENYAALYNLINQKLDDESFGLLPQPMRTGSFEFLCRSTISAATLADALHRASRFLHIVLPDLAVEIRRDKNIAELVIREVQPLAAHLDDPGRVFAFEWLLRLLHSLACWLAGRGLALDSVAFPYPQPAHADDYALIFTEHSSFLPSPSPPAPLPAGARGANQLTSPHGSNTAPLAPFGRGGLGVLIATFNPNLLDLPIRRDEAALVAFLDGAPGKITTLYRRDREMVIRVRDLLRAALPNPQSLEQIADQLHLSPRTVHRRLEEEGSSFRAIKDALRRDMALARLTKTRDPVAQVAADLGYADASAFYRAFVEWTGMAPLHYRQRSQHNG